MVFLGYLSLGIIASVILMTIFDSDFSKSDLLVAVGVFSPMLIYIIWTLK